MRRFLKIVILLLWFNSSFIECRNHIIALKNEKRHGILLSHFGYNPNACLYLNIEKFNTPLLNSSRFGFSLDHSSSSGVAEFIESSPPKCFLDDRKVSSLHLNYNHINHSMIVDIIGEGMNGLLIYKDVQFSPDNNSTQLGTFNMTGDVQNQLENNLRTLFTNFVDKTNASHIANQTLQPFKQSFLTTATEQKALLSVVAMKDFANVKNNLNVISDLKMVLIMAKKAMGNKWTETMQMIWTRLQAPVHFHVEFPLKMLIKFPTSNEEGDYDLYFHNCAPLKTAQAPVNLSMTVIEKNWNSYLSAGDQPLPLLFFIMCSAYIILTVIWSLTIFTSEHSVFKIHYLMLTLLIMKSLTLFFHGINYYELGRNGVPEQGWAIMYYITHLLKGALLFTTIILIGAGWAFIKHMLSGKERNIFIIIIPLQILANVAAIIIDESEESAVRYLTWRNIFLLVDLICCGAILFPVIWSIKHLKEAANIDGKQAHNLQKLKLFRHFYILIICYIYSTRIIVYLLVITVSFKLYWTVDLFREVSTIFFMIVTGYKFRPVSNNPYLLVPEDDEQVTEEEQLEHAWSQSGMTDGVVKINQLTKTTDSDNDGDGDSSDKCELTQPQNIVRTLTNTNNNTGNGFIHTSQL